MSTGNTSQILANINKHIGHVNASSHNAKLSSANPTEIDVNNDGHVSEKEYDNFFVSKFKNESNPKVMQMWSMALSGAAKESKNQTLVSTSNSPKYPSDAYVSQQQAMQSASRYNQITPAKVHPWLQQTSVNLPVANQYLAPLPQVSQALSPAYNNPIGNMAYVSTNFSSGLSPTNLGNYMHLGTTLDSRDNSFTHNYNVGLKTATAFVQIMKKEGFHNDANMILNSIKELQVANSTINAMPKANIIFKTKTFDLPKLNALVSRNKNMFMNTVGQSTVGIFSPNTQALPSTISRPVNTVPVNQKPATPAVSSAATGQLGNVGLSGFIRSERVSGQHNDIKDVLLNGVEGMKRSANGKAITPKHRGLTTFVSSQFGPRGRGFHRGIDIALHHNGKFGGAHKALAGDRHYSPFNGKVTRVHYQKGGAGWYLRYKTPGGYDVFTMHLQQKPINPKTGKHYKVGDKIEIGQDIGPIGSTGGSTGAHIHFEIRDPRGRAIDPERFDWKAYSKAALATEKTPQRSIVQSNNIVPIKRAGTVSTGTVNYNNFQFTPDFISQVKIAEASEEGKGGLPAYNDYGQISIGYGTRTKPGERIGTKISEAEADKRLRAELRATLPFIKSLNDQRVRNGHRPLTYNAVQALTSFFFNLGASRKGKETITANIMNGNDTAVVKNFAMYNKASGKPLAGLTKRRAAEAARYARAMGVVSAGIR